MRCRDDPQCRAERRCPIGSLAAPGLGHLYGGGRSSERFPRSPKKLMYGQPEVMHKLRGPLGGLRVNHIPERADVAPAPKWLQIFDTWGGVYSATWAYEEFSLNYMRKNQAAESGEASRKVPVIVFHQERGQWLKSLLLRCGLP